MHESNERKYKCPQNKVVRLIIQEILHHPISPFLKIIERWQLKTSALQSKIIERPQRGELQKCFAQLDTNFNKKYNPKNKHHQEFVIKTFATRINHTIRRTNDKWSRTWHFFFLIKEITLLQYLHICCFCDQSKHIIHVCIKCGCECDKKNKS